MSNNFLTNILKGIIKRCKNVFYNEFEEFGLSFLKVKKLKHQGYNNPGEFTLKGNLIKFNHPPEILHSLKEIFVDKIYKLKLNNANPFFIDCGSNIGLSIINLKMQYPDAKIICFEPDEKNFELLTENTKGLSNITLENKAISNKNGEIKFEMSGTLGSNSLSVNESNNYKTVKTARLKDYLKTHVHFLKIDIEGAEYDVLMDCKEELINVDNLFLEYHGNFNQNGELNDLLLLFTEKNFNYYIKEADNVYPTPFFINEKKNFDLQLNIFAFKKN